MLGNAHRFEFIAVFDLDELMVPASGRVQGIDNDMLAAARQLGRSGRTHLEMDSNFFPDLAKLAETNKGFSPPE